MTIMGVIYTELKQTVLNSWNVKTTDFRRGSRQGRIQGGDRPPPIPTSQNRRQKVFNRGALHYKI